MAKSQAPADAAPPDAPKSLLTPELDAYARKHLTEDTVPPPSSRPLMAHPPDTGIPEPGKPALVMFTVFDGG